MIGGGKHIAVSIAAGLVLISFLVVLARAGQNGNTVIATGTLNELGSKISIPTDLTLIEAGDEQTSLSHPAGSALSLQKKDTKESRKPVGVVAQMRVQPGDRVKSGDILFTIDDAEARANLDKAQARYDIIAGTIEKLTGTRIDGGGQELQDGSYSALKKIAVLQKRRDQANVAVLIAKKVLGATTIKATGSGIVKDLRINEGSVVYAGQPAISVVQSKTLSLDIFMSVSEAAKIRRGKPVDVEVDAGPGIIFRGRVTAVAGKAGFAPSNMSTSELELLRVVKVTVEVENKDGILKAGMPADVIIR
jgi:multidrug efflux pump subunit AcrA (membrane-fusion protein)